MNRTSLSSIDLYGAQSRVDNIYLQSLQRPSSYVNDHGVLETILKRHDTPAPRRPHESSSAHAESINSFVRDFRPVENHSRRPFEQVC